MVDDLKEGKSFPNNIILLDYIIGVQLEKIENSINTKTEGYLFESGELTMSNLVELLKLRNNFNI